MKKFYYLANSKLLNQEAIIEVEGYEIDSTAFIYHDTLNKVWKVTDKATGLYVILGKTKKETLERFERIKGAYHDYMTKNPMFTKQKERFEELMKEYLQKCQNTK